MHLKTFRAENFRRLKNVRVDLEEDQTVFVGANNSGKTSGTHLFRRFLGPQRGDFQIYDFTADCWTSFEAFDLDQGDPDLELPRIVLDLWFDVDVANLHRVTALLPDLDWDGEPVGVRLSFQPKDGRQLIANYTEAREQAQLPSETASTPYLPWPQTLVDYLTKKLTSEYDIAYYVLDRRHCDEDLLPDPAQELSQLNAGKSTGAKVIDSLLRVDFLDAQRHLTDVDSSRSRGEDLSRRLGQYYSRHLQQPADDIELLEAVAESEGRLNTHFDKVFAPILDRLGEVGYPGVTHPELVVRATVDAYDILSSKGQVFYNVPGPAAGSGTAALQLPDQYNGLGFKNLIYMVVEMVDLREAWASIETDRPPVHLVMVEEPESHLHAQLQQVFIDKIRAVLPEDDAGFLTQLVVTTHSPHIVYESDFRPIRYFARVGDPGSLQLSEVRNLSLFYDQEEETTRTFLQQYIKLTHCDLFFADGAVLVEGNVERLLLPLVIDREVPQLRSCHLTILEVGGAFAHKFAKLIDFLGLTTLVVTDLDSVDPLAGRATCPVETSGAVTTNQTLATWLPRLTAIADLLEADDGTKTLSAGGPVRVAYQTRQPATWADTTLSIAGRTLEEAFALENLAWTQEEKQQQLGLRVPNADTLSLEQLRAALHQRVAGRFDKTGFALAVLADPEAKWVAPAYMVEGLKWLSAQLQQETGA